MSIVIGCIFLFAGWRTIKGDPSKRTNRNKRIVPFSKDAWAWLNGVEESIPPGTAKKRK